MVAVGRQAHKFQLFDFRFASFTPDFFRRTYSFWAGLLGGCFLTMASHGTEQLLVQRLLSARNETESRLALFSSWVRHLFPVCAFSCHRGSAVCLTTHDTGRVAPAVPERTYPEFIWNHLPVGLAGLVIAAILAAAMSNFSAALNALASTTVMDFLRPLRPDHTEDRVSALAR